MPFSTFSYRKTRKNKQLPSMTSGHTPQLASAAVRGAIAAAVFKGISEEKQLLFLLSLVLLVCMWLY